MKFIISLLLISFQFSAFAQSKEHAGNYEFFMGNNDSHFLKDKLTLNPNGTFLFKSESYLEERMERHRLQYGKGTWRSEKRLIFLKVEDSDVDATHELNLNNTRLRFDTKSPRDKTNRDIKTSVRVIDSEIRWLKGRTLIKDANTKPIINEKACCSSVWQVHSYLHGKWKNNNKPSNEYHYSFKDEKGSFDAYKKTENGTLEPINNNTAQVRILKTENGYEIEQIFDGLSTISGIKHLDSNKLIMVRKDGKESVLHRIKE
ncbi:MAG: hypothetical protein HKO72_04565 [Flavobacteriaceae bacterium]|nr:hypothetical protein [Bacteroidia bacterium]NNL60592.1 hypothetical protein [Flavobacteriaceae bacterium]